MQKLKLSARTVQILKNFSSINPSMLFRKGSVVSTISPSKSIMAKARVEEKFDSEFAIYDISRFLGVYSLFKDPEIVINDNFATIVEEGKKLNYVFADPKNIISAPEKNIKLPSVEVEFEMSNAAFNDVNKVMAVLRMPEMTVHGHDGKIFLRASDSSNPSSDTYDVEVGETDGKFDMIFKSENLKIIPDDYAVQICSKGISKFSSKDMEYFIAVEQNSKFDG